MESAIGNLEESVSIFAFQSNEYKLSALDIHETSNIACVVKLTLFSRVTGAESRWEAGHDRVADRRIREGL